MGYECPYCNKKPYKRYGSWVNHIKKVHRSNPDQAKKKIEKLRGPDPKKKSKSPPKRVRKKKPDKESEKEEVLEESVEAEEKEDISGGSSGSTSEEKVPILEFPCPYCLCIAPFSEGSWEEHVKKVHRVSPEQARTKLDPDKIPPKRSRPSQLIQKSASWAQKNSLDMINLISEIPEHLLNPCNLVTSDGADVQTYRTKDGLVIHFHRKSCVISIYYDGWKKFKDGEDEAYDAVRGVLGDPDKRGLP